MARKKVADASEVLEALTSIMRKEEEVKPSEMLRAAELLGKRYGLFGEHEGTTQSAPQIVVNVPRKEEKA